MTTRQENHEPPERPDIVTLTNPRAERVRSVARLSGRSARRRDRRFVAEGPQAVREAVTSHQLGRPGAVRDLYVTAAAGERFAPIVDAARVAGITVYDVSDEVFAAMTGPDSAVTPQGLLAVCDLVGVELRDVLDGGPKLVAVLSQVRDPGNAGTVIRAADAAGADAVVLTASSVDVHNSKCVRATAGSLFHLPVVTGRELADVVEQLRSAGLRVLAADGGGTTDLDDLQNAAEAGAEGGLRGRVAWIFGNEAWGLDADDAALADDVVRVPVHGRAESLNLATAATVCLYATARAQRRADLAV